MRSRSIKEGDRVRLRAAGSQNTWVEGRVIATGATRDTYHTIAVVLPDGVYIPTIKGDKLGGTIPLIVDYQHERAYLYWDHVESFELGDEPGTMIHLINGQ